MNHLRLYLWKEWRDQRTGVVGIAVALPLLFALAWIAGLLGERAFLKESLQPGIAAAFGGLLALFVVGTELLPGERHRRTLRFLERIPGSLKAAFTAKLVFFLFTTAVAALYAGVLATSIAFLWSGAWPVPTFSSHWAHEARLVLPAMGVALWIFSVSAWVPRGTLAFPAAALCLALLCWPAWALCGGFEGLHAFEWEIAAFPILCAVGACLSAYASFVLGSRRGGSHVRSACFGLATAAAVLAPAWVWTALRIDAHLNIDPASDDFRLVHARLFDRGARAEVWAHRELPWLDRAQGSSEGPTHALVADLSTGEFERATEEGADARTLALVRPPVDLERFPWAYEGFLVARARLERAHRTGAPNAGTVRRDLESYPRAKPAAESIGLSSSDFVLAWAGLGFFVQVGEGRAERTGFFDPFTCRFTSSAELAQFGFARNRTHFTIGPRGWLVEDTAAFEFRRWSPGEALPAEPLRSLAPHDRVAGMLLDGRVLACGDGRAFVVDLERDERTFVRFEGADPGRIDGLSNPTGGSMAPIEFSAPAIVSVWSERGSTLARFDAATLTLHCAPTRAARVVLVDIADEEHVVVIEDERRLVRLAFDGTERVVLFPRTSAAP